MYSIDFGGLKSPSYHCRTI